MATHLRNETKSAGTIAAFCDLDEGVMTRSREHAGRRFIVEISRALIAERNYRQRSGICFGIADTKDVVYLTCADERINLRHLGFQLIAISLNQTARYD